MKMQCFTKNVNKNLLNSRLLQINNAHCIPIVIAPFFVRALHVKLNTEYKVEHSLLKSVYSINSYKVFVNYLKRQNSSIDFKYLSSHTYPMESEWSKTFPNLAKIGALGRDDIKIKNKSNVEQLLSSLWKGKFDNLQLVVDFDYTLTKGHINGEVYHCSWGILDNSPHMPSFYREEALKNLKKFYPIEIDATMSEEEKIPHMLEWYNNILELLKQCSLSKEAIKDMVSCSNVRLRDHADSLLRKLKEENVPVLIFSAGMGDVLEHVLWHFGVYTDNVKVVSNFFKYNEKGTMVSFQGELIHMFNKNENSIHSSDYFGQLKERTNVILMGDSLGDIKMAIGVPQHSNILKIGFLNDKINERLDSYLEAYDIVLIKDQTMNVVNSIISHMQSL